MMTLILSLLQIFTAPAPATPDSASCPDLSEAIADATYIEGRGCVVDGIADYCDRAYGGSCPTWAQVQEHYGLDADRLLTCEGEGTVANRNVYDATSWYLQEDFDNTGQMIGALTYSYGDTADPYCCDGVTSSVLRWGDSDGVCTPLEPDDTGEADTAEAGATDTADTPKTGPCGCATDKGAVAAVFLTALTLSATCRRRLNFARRLHVLPRPPSPGSSSRPYR